VATNQIQAKAETEPLVETNVSNTPSFGDKKAEKLPSPQSDRVGLGAKKRHYRSPRNRLVFCVRCVVLESFRGPITQG
jgi:hypothetical protein